MVVACDINCDNDSTDSGRVIVMMIMIHKILTTLMISFHDNVNNVHSNDNDDNDCDDSDNNDIDDDEHM